MISNTPGRFRAPTSEELAASMREGLESRRFYRKAPIHPEAIPAPPAIGHLAGVFGTNQTAIPTLGDVPLAASGGLRGRLIGLLRRVVRKVMWPWFDYLSGANAERERFDRAVLQHLDALAGTVGALTRQVQALQQEVVPGYQSANGRLNECFHDLYRVRHLLGGDGAAEPASIPSAGGLHVIEGLFLHTRLPAPPARVLTLTATHALDLASLGFQVVTAGQVAERHPDLREAGGGGAPALPFPDAAFEVVVALSGDGVGAGAAGPWTEAGADAREELARVLVRGGLVIGSVRVADDPPCVREVEALVAPLRLLEVAYATRAGDGWGLHPEPVVGCEAALWVAVLR